LNNLDDLAARHRTLSYEHERLSKQHAQSRNIVARCEAETQGWKARCAELEKRFSLEEAKVKELREEVARGRKALEGVRVAAVVRRSPNRNGKLMASMKPRRLS
jgi:uncharacterized coiled-coil protein SlyX